MIHNYQEWLDGWVSMSEINRERFQGDPGMDPDILTATDNLEFEEGPDWVEYTTEEAYSEPMTQEKIEECERQMLRFDPPF